MKLKSVLCAIGLAFSCSLVSVASAKECKVGDKAKVLWNGYQYQATLKAKKDATFCIHYDGWEAKWDECVAPARFTCTGTAAFAKGETVEVEWKAAFYEAKILSVKEGKYCITYVGWASSWDECVGPQRVRQK